MRDEQLVAFVRTLLEKGYAREQIALFLEQKGYSPEEVREAVYSYEEHTTVTHKRKKPLLILIPVILLIITGLAVSAIFTGPACTHDTECDDTDPSTRNVCLNPGERNAKCMNPVVVEVGSTGNRVTIGEEGSVSFSVGESDHILVLKSTDNNEASIILYSRPREYTIALEEHIEVDSNNDGAEDLHIRLVSIEDATAEFEIRTIPQRGSIGITIHSAKDTYEMGEEFAAEYTLDYVGDPFTAVVLVTYSRVEVDREAHTRRMGTLSEHNTHLARGSLSTFRIGDTMYAKGDDQFLEEGNYTFTVSVFACEDLERELNTSCTELSSDEVAGTTPLESNQKTILVRGGTSLIECVSSHECSLCEGCRDGMQICESSSSKCMDCFMDLQCIEGYMCKDNTCVEWECDFDSQCDEDSTVQIGACIDNKCVYTPKPDEPTEQTTEQDTDVCGSTVVDCGRSDSVNDCFMEQASNCCPATILTEIEIEIFGMVISTQTHRELKGMENDRCIFYERTDDISLEYTTPTRQAMLEAGMSEEEIEAELIEQNQLAREETVGEEGTCKYPVSDLITKLDNEREGLFVMTSEDVAKYDCSGSKYDDLR